MSPTCHILPRSGKWQVRYRLGGRETTVRSAGTFATLKAARERRALVERELAAGRDPRLAIEALSRPPRRVTIREAAAMWRRSRIDIADNTANVHRKSLVHVEARFGDREPESITPAEVAAWIGELAAADPPDPTGRGRAEPYTPGYIRKIVDALAMVLDHHGVAPNPVRDKRVRLPRNVREEIDPPEAEAVEAVLGAVAPRYRLPIIVLDATGMRVGELEGLTWGDLDAQHARWRVARQREKAGRGRWVPVPPDVFAAVEALTPREDRDLSARVFGWLVQANLRREIARACKATGTALWSPHDLRHRRISLWHREGVSWAQVGEWAGQRDIATTLNRYTHVVPGREIDRGGWLEPIGRFPSRVERGGV
jgi:integrase